MSRILVIGSVNLDLSAAVSRLPQPGETVTGAKLARFPGGKGANQALAAKRLGADVVLLACVGADPAANEALALVREGHVNLRHIRIHTEAATGIALIAVAESGENQIVVAPGANAELTLDGIDLPRADAMICQLEVPAATALDAVMRFDGFICMNLAPAREVDDALIERADLVVVNEIEAAFYGERLVACRGYVAMTHGRNGAELRRRGEVVARAPAPEVKAIDTVGAGDAFTAAVTVALVEGREPDEALAFACAAGSLATTRQGAQPSLPTRKEVDALIRGQRP